MVNQLAKDGKPDSLRIVRNAQVRTKLDVSEAKLFDMIAKGLFLKPFQIVPGGRAVGWLESDVDQWILEQKRRSEGGGQMLAIIPPPKTQPSSNQTSIQGTLQVALPIQHSLPKVAGPDG
jgi:prophage regulatory protein